VMDKNKIVIDRYTNRARIQHSTICQTQDVGVLLRPHRQIH
jgi:hypothetical protein